ncbi:MAG: hypothetical protein KGY45_04505 [Hadesarchaea archaeon]|nr:hypothetical protein [Hadesarchaea archaeon]
MNKNSSSDIRDEVNSIIEKLERIDERLKSLEELNLSSNSEKHTSSSSTKRTKKLSKASSGTATKQKNGNYNYLKKTISDAKRRYNRERGA